MGNFTYDDIAKFFEGRNPMQHIVAIECNTGDDKASIIYKNAEGEKRIKIVDFFPFIWCKEEAFNKLFGGNEAERTRRMKYAGITYKRLRTYNDDKVVPERLRKGYNILVESTKPMSFGEFQRFFKSGGIDIYAKNNGCLRAGSPVEQLMVRDGYRFFKGYNDYDDLVRLTYDLETTGLDPKDNYIDQIGICTNKGFRTIIAVDGFPGSEVRRRSELEAIRKFWDIIRFIKPDVITGHNIKGFDFPFIFCRTEEDGSSTRELTPTYHDTPARAARPSILKLGGEIEEFFDVKIWGHSVTDSLHAVRRMQAMDSSMKKADLKYSAKYLGIAQTNRVYMKNGQNIGKIWADTDHVYAINENNGEWYVISDTNPIKPGFKEVSGRYVIERYLEGDLYEGDRVEKAVNDTNFQITKIIPTSFGKACTMGTAGLWKLIMMEWSFIYGLGIPDFGPKQDFVGGLSRLVETGYVYNVIKLDYNSLYPSIILSYFIKTINDISGGMTFMLDYVLTQREVFKGLKKKEGKEVDERENLLKSMDAIKDLAEVERVMKEKGVHQALALLYDKKQMQLKVLGNSYFGSFGAQYLFNWGDTECACETTCIGRMSLRLMISWFQKRGYLPIVGDSFTGDTPVFIRYNKTGNIAIVPISRLINTDKIEIDGLGREYDYSPKDFLVLCRSGWVPVQYIYRHKTTKDIYEIRDEEKGMLIEVTEDHSLFNDRQEKISPKDIKKDTQLEWNRTEIYKSFNKNHNLVSLMRCDKVHIEEGILNADILTKMKWVHLYGNIDWSKISKTEQAKADYIKKCIGG